jgi:hypothetical protein
MTLTLSEARISMKALQLTVIMGLLASAACNKPKDTPAADSHSGMKMDSGGMRGVAGMGGSGMMSMTPAHMDSMMRMSPEQMSGMMATHERMMSQMMDQMGGEMRQMKMSESKEWRALTDSVKQDLAELPALKGDELAARMKEHAERVQRLMAMHEGMMKGK